MMICFPVSIHKASPSGLNCERSLEKSLHKGSPTCLNYQKRLENLYIKVVLHA